MTQLDQKRAHPLLWVPSLYFAMGTPMIAVSVVAAIMYKNFGLSNTEIAAYTGAMYLPWVIKPLWAPLVELFRSKRFFVLAMELTMVVTFTCLALALRLPAYLPLTIALFWATGFASATQDIAGDGVFLTSTTAKEQGLYIGIQGAFWNLARVLVSGALVSLTQLLFSWAAAGRPAGTGPHPAWFTAWMVIMLLVAAILAATAIWHYYLLPPGTKAGDSPSSVRAALVTTGDAWASFFKKPRVWMMIATVFLYRFGEGFIEKIGPLFLMDSRAVGGLGLSNMALGNINGFFGTIAFVGGTLLGGVLAARYTLRRVFVILAFALNVPHITFFYLANALPHDLTWITCVVLIEKLGYGLGTVGMMLYMMQELSPGRYRTAHYAFATGIMALNMMLTGMVSGRIEAWLGYRTFFGFVLLASLPPILMAWMAPFRTEEEKAEAEGQTAAKAQAG